MSNFEVGKFVHLKNDGYGYDKGTRAHVRSAPDGGGRQKFMFLTDYTTLNLKPEEFEALTLGQVLEAQNVYKTSSKPEAVQHPAHYGGGDNPYEAIKVIEAWDLGFHTGNTVKYISRAGKKVKAKELEDIDKAIWYLQRHRENLVAENA